MRFSLQISSVTYSRSSSGAAASCTKFRCDVGKERSLRFRFALEAAPRKELVLKAGDEALSPRVVVGVAHGSHRGAYAEFTAALPEGQSRALTALIL